MKTLFVFLVLLVAYQVAATLRASPGGEPTLYASLKAKDIHRLRDLLKELRYDVAHSHKHDSVHVFLSEDEFSELQNLNILDQLFILANKTADNMPFKYPANDLMFLGKVPKGYHNLEEIVTFLRNTEKDFPKIAKLVNIAKEYGPGQTHEGRPIYAMKLSKNVHKDEDEPNILIVSLHHAREITTTELSMYTIAKLTSEYGKDPVITRALNENQIWIVPVVNPDGLHHVFTKNNWWRKNKRNHGNNTFGVDLNRNYDLGWHKCVAKVDQTDDVYKGPHPFSEPEVQTLVGFSRRYPPAKVLDFHSYGNEVLTGYLCTKIPTSIGVYINETGKRLASSCGFETRPPSDDGEHQEYHIKQHTNFAFLVEIGDAFQPDYETCKKDVRRVWPLIYKFLNVSIPLRGHVSDAKSGKPIQARIFVQGVEWKAGETRTSDAKHGAYSMFLLKGEHKITFAAPGYQSKTVTVHVPDMEEAGIVQDVQLEKKTLLNKNV
jgi:murein tripeptide amidase MpaA